MNYFTKFEFLKLTDIEKKDYYEALIDEKSEILTVKELDELILAFDVLEGYGDSANIVNELKKAAAKQRIQDKKYNSERKKKGFLIVLASVAVVVLAVSVYIIISMLG